MQALHWTAGILQFTGSLDTSDTHAQLADALHHAPLPSDFILIPVNIARRWRVFTLDLARGQHISPCAIILLLLLH